jgi:hypothetical protein
MQRIMVLGLMIAGLAACSGAEESAAEAEGPAEAVVTDAKPAAPEPIAASPVETTREEAEAFVRALYERMEDDTFAPLAEGADRTVFTTEVVRMLDRARSGDEGMHPALEADPVCLCQDPYGLTLREVTVIEATADRAAARVRFDFGKADDAESARAPLFILRREADGWRVDDIRTDGGFSFRRTLAE